MATEKKRVVALFDYESEEKLELSFKKGQEFHLLKVDEASGWSQGELGGQIGWFPSEFVKEVESAAGATRPASHTQVWRSIENILTPMMEEGNLPEDDAPPTPPPEEDLEFQPETSEAHEPSVDSSAAPSTATRRVVEPPRKTLPTVPSAATKPAPPAGPSGGVVRPTGSVPSRPGASSVKPPTPASKPALTASARPTTPAKPLPASKPAAPAAQYSEIPVEALEISASKPAIPRTPSSSGGVGGPPTGSLAQSMSSVAFQRATSPREPLDKAGASRSDDVSRESRMQVAYLARRVEELETQLRSTQSQLAKFVEGASLLPAIMRTLQSHDSGSVAAGGGVLAQGLPQSYKEVAEDELACGWLEKKGRQRKNWKRRWFVLKGTRLQYYEKAGDKKVVGEINVETCAVEPPMERPESQKKCMALLVEGRKLLFIADTEEENYAWYLLLVAKNAEAAYVKKLSIFHAKPDMRVVALLHNPFRASFYLDGQQLSLEAAGALNTVIRNHHLLTLLHLKEAQLDDLGVAALADGLRHNTSLTHINLAGNRITSEGVGSLVTALSGRKSLRALHLQRNPLGARSVAPLAELMAATPSLARLKLHECQLGDAGLASLGKGLLGGPDRKFPRLELRSNGISDSGLMSLLQGLPPPAAAATVTVLDLAGNDFSPAGLAAMATALRPRTAITHVLASSWSVPPPSPRDYADAVKAFLTYPNLQRLELGPLRLDSGALSVLILQTVLK